jgi:hypothetical protein
MRSEMRPHDAWGELIRDIEASCVRHGYWSGEVRRLRDAIGARKMGVKIADRMRQLMADAGYEIDGELEFESLEVRISPTGTLGLALTLEPVIERIRYWDRQVLDAPWRDHLIALHAAGQHLAGHATAVPSPER